MFTGLVQAVGTVSLVVPRPKGVRLGVDVGSWGYGRRARAGDSVNVSGVCLTVVSKPGRKAGSKQCVFQFDVVQETLDKTRLGSLVVGDQVNLEHAATASTLMGGHIVQGHADGVGRVVRVGRADGWKVWIALPAVKSGPPGLAKAGARKGITSAKGAEAHSSEEDLWDYLVPQGSVCVDGVSLTIAGLWDNSAKTKGRPGSAIAQERGRGFAVALIPTTLRETTLIDLREGSAVNLEMDVIAKMVVQAVNAHSAKFLRSSNSRRGRIASDEVAALPPAKRYALGSPARLALRTLSR